MATISGYTRLPDTIRENTLAAARRQAERAAERYARLLAAEAGIAARAAYPTVARLVFRLTDDVTGPSATLIAAYTAHGRQLWHIDTDEEWPGRVPRHRPPRRRGRLVRQHLQRRRHRLRR